MIPTYRLGSSSNSRGRRTTSASLADTERECSRLSRAARYPTDDWQRSRRSMSERILVSRDLTWAPINPHWLVALAWAVVGHAGSAPGRSRDLAAHGSECPRWNAAIVSSRLNGNWRS
jgi:hypothetical protein